MDNDSQYRNRRNRMFNKMEAYVDLKAVVPWIINNRDRRWKIPMNGTSDYTDIFWGDAPKESREFWDFVLNEAVIKGGRFIMELDKTGNPEDENATNQTMYLLATVELIHPDGRRGGHVFFKALLYDEEGYPTKEVTKHYAIP